MTCNSWLVKIKILFLSSAFARAHLSLLFPLISFSNIAAYSVECNITDYDVLAKKRYSLLVHRIKKFKIARLRRAMTNYGDARTREKERTRFREAITPHRILIVQVIQHRPRIYFRSRPGATYPRARFYSRPRERISRARKLRVGRNGIEMMNTRQRERRRNWNCDTLNAP